MSWGIQPYPPKETEHDTMQQTTSLTNLTKTQTLSSSAVSSSTVLPSMNNIPGTTALLNDTLNRNIPTNTAYSTQDYVSSSNKLAHNSLDKSAGRYSVHNKHEYLPNFVSDSVSPRSSVDGLNHHHHASHHHSNSFYQHQHHPLELPSPSSSTSSQASKTNAPNVSSSVSSLFGSYSPSPFTVSVKRLFILSIEDLIN